MSPDTGVEVDTRLAFLSQLKALGNGGIAECDRDSLDGAAYFPAEERSDFSLPPGIRRACSMVSSVMFW